MKYLLWTLVIRSAAIRPFVYVRLEQNVHSGVLESLGGDDAD